MATALSIMPLVVFERSREVKVAVIQACLQKVNVNVNSCHLLVGYFYLQ